ncbi:MAG: oligopeptidase A [bacterium]
MKNNPLLTQTGLPQFSAIKPEHIEPAIDALLAENRERIAKLLANTDKPTWHNLVEPIEEWEDRLGRAWSPVSHMNSVVSNDELRAAHNACLPKLSEYGTEMGQNKALYEAYKQVADQNASLDTAQQKVLSNALRDFHLSGVDLPADKQARYKEIAARLSELTSKFEEHLLDATNTWHALITDKSALAGMPDSALELAAQTAAERDQQGWMLTLDFPLYFPVITYADDRELRHRVYEAYNTRASELGPNAGEYDNSAVMDELLALRHEQAQLLGFENYAERSLARKMARTTDEVMEFLTDLAIRSKAQAEQELDELRRFAQDTFGIEALEPWDIAYYSEKLRQQRYSISQEDLKPYFPETRVIPGMFEVIGKLFNVSIQETDQDVDVWHPDVRFYEIRDPGGELRGQFYFDLYARAKKRGGAWMDDCITRMHSEHRSQTPVAYMTCNFSPPVGDKPALLTHNEVETLFHEFGHGLHHMLTRVDYPAVAGINGVAWDAVELPSQFMENWCWQKEALSLFSGHFDTGEPLPDEMFERMLAAKNFQSAMMMVRQLEFSLFDFRIHREYDPGQGARIYQILNEVRDQVAVIKPPAWNRFAHGFSHIFAGGYAAGYYSYKWAEVLSADAFSLFEEKGIFDQETGESFLHNILEKGGSEDAMNLFVAFRGREPEIDALLRHSGIAA